MDRIPNTLDVVSSHIGADTTYIVYEYLLFRLYTQKEYATYGIHEALAYPDDDNIHDMVYLFDDDTIFETINMCALYKETYISLIFAKRFDLADRVATAYKRIYRQELYIKAFLHIGEIEEEYEPNIFTNISTPKNIIPSGDIIDYIYDLFDNKDYAINVIHSLLFDGVITYKSIMESKYSLLITQRVLKSSIMSQECYYKYEYLLYRYNHGYEISKSLSQIYGFTESKTPMLLTSKIFMYNTEKINYRNIYKNIHFPLLIKAISGFKYDRIKYILDCTDIISGYDNNLVYKISYNVYKHLLPTYNDIKYDPEMMYIYSLIDNDPIGMKHAFPMIYKTKLNIKLIKSAIVESDDLDISLEQFILDMKNKPPDRKTISKRNKKTRYVSEIYENIIKKAFYQNKALVLITMVKIGYKISEKIELKYIHYNFYNDQIDAFIVAYNNKYIRKKGMHIYDLNECFRYKITKWLLTNTKQKIRNINHLSSDHFKNLQMTVSLSYVMDAKEFIEKYFEYIRIDAVRLICLVRGLDINVVLSSLFC